MKNPRHELYVGTVTLDQWIRWRVHQNLHGFEPSNQLATAKKIAEINDKAARELLLKLHNFATLHYNQLEELRNEFILLNDALKIHFPDEVKSVVGK